MSLIAICAILITFFGSLFLMAGRTRGQQEQLLNADQVHAYKIEEAVQEKKHASSGIWVLVIFGCIVGIYGIYLLVQYWPEIIKNKDKFNCAIGLFLVMIFGMLVQVITANRKAGHKLFYATCSQYFFPLLFAIVVYYPLWGIIESSKSVMFSIYAAFLNGYFWESVVSSVKKPDET